MATDTIRADVLPSIRAPFKKAFSGSGSDPYFLYAAEEKNSLITAYRWAFEEPGNPAWQHQFNSLYNICYGDDENSLTGTWWNTVETRLGEWTKIMERGMRHNHRISVQLSNRLCPSG